MRIHERSNLDLPDAWAYDSGSGVLARDREHAEHGEEECHSRGCARPRGDADRRWVRRATHWQVGEECVELAVRPGCEQRFEPLFKLLRAEPPLRRRVA